jgi:hypothetical protein
MICLLARGEQKFWSKTEAGAWTPEQISEFTQSSPWAKQVTAVLSTNGSNMAADAVRPAGRGGRSGRSGSDVPQPAELPKWQALVRWVSAKPMKEILKLHLPPDFDGHYVISVSGLPLGEDTTEIASQTTLQLKRGDPVHPETAYQDPGDTSTIYFAFVPSTLDVSSSKTAVFSMLAQPYEIRAKFSLSEMKYLGQTSF